MSEAPAPLWVWDGIHAGVEPTGTAVVDYLDRNPSSGFFTSRVHPEAVQKGVRFLDDKEIGRYFCDSTFDRPLHTLNADERAVHKFVVEDSLNRPSDWSMIIDIHTAPSRNANAVMLGSRIELGVLALANVLGINNAILLPGYPLYDLFPTLVSVETAATPQSNPLLQPEYWHAKLIELSQWSHEKRYSIAEKMHPLMRYHTQIDLMRLKFDGTVDKDTLELVDWLEAHPLQSRDYFTPVKIPLEHQQRLNIEGANISIGGWDDYNHSPDMPELFGYRDDGRPRKLAFGALLIEAQVYRPTNETVRLFNHSNAFQG